MFDVPPPYDGVRGIDAYRESWPPFFDWLRQGAEFELVELDVTAGAMSRSRTRCCAAVHRPTSRPTRTTGCGSPSGCARTTAAGSLCTNIIRSRWWTRPHNPGIAVCGGYAMALVRAALRRVCMALFAAGLVGANVFGVPVAGAAGQIWNGKYLLLRYASGKTGTSLAARQPEPDFSDIYTFVTDCSRGTCVATVVDGPRPTTRRSRCRRSTPGTAPPGCTSTNGSGIAIWARVRC